MEVPVALSTCLSEDTSINDSPVIFDVVDLNIADGYDEFTVKLITKIGFIFPFKRLKNKINLWASIFTTKIIRGRPRTSRNGGRSLKKFWIGSMHQVRRGWPLLDQPMISKIFQVSSDLLLTVFTCQHVTAWFRVLTEGMFISSGMMTSCVQAGSTVTNTTQLRAPP